MIDPRLPESDEGKHYPQEDDYPDRTRESVLAALSAARIQREAAIAPEFGGCPSCRTFPCRCHQDYRTKKELDEWGSLLLGRDMADGYPTGFRGSNFET